MNKKTGGANAGKLPEQAPKTTERNTNSDKNVERAYDQERHITREDPEFTSSNLDAEERRLTDQTENDGY